MVGTIYVYSQEVYDQISAVATTATVILKEEEIDTSELEAAITAAEAIDTSVYTTASLATLTDAVTAGKTVLNNEDATQTEINNAATAITDAIDALVTLLAEAIENAESAIEAAEMIDTTNCTEDSVAALTAAIEAAKTAIADESATADSVEAVVEAVNAAVAELEGVIYVTEDEELYNSISSAATSATVIYVAESGLSGQVLANIYYGGNTLYQIATGTAGSDIAGATSVKVYFDCASDVSYNPYASIDLYAVVNSTQNYAQIAGTDSSYSSGTTGWSETLSLENAIAEGDTYTISGATWSWSGAEDYVYAVTKVEFLDDSGAVLATIDPNVANDLTELKAAIVEADAVDETVYTDNSVATMNEALAAAITVIGNADATQDEVDAATAALTAAIAGLVDTSDLEGTIATAEDIDTSAFTPSSVAAMTEALESAKETLANADVTQDEVNAAVDALTEAINGLTELADTTDLVGTITDAEAVDTSAYTPSSVAALEAALEDAKTVLDNADATQDEVNAAVDALTEAINGLTELADTTDLETAIADAETVDATLYTSSSVADLTAALEDAKAVLENADATQDEVDAAASALTSAINSLVSAYSITGTVYVSDSDTETTMTVAVTLADGTEVSAEATSMGEYAIEGLDAGTYTITISGGKYAPRSYEVEVSESLTQDVYLNPYGDVNGDGNVTTADVGLANSHAKNVTLLEDYEFVCADVNLDGSVTTADVGKINSHAKGVVALW
ncbi:MAG: carboxypeptidase regulatory-like domain-containing protein [Ruminococcus sp.]|nr:carboxypeptidase regulatory-like domain-containing protein [Ruminococcus sp.]